MSKSDGTSKPSFADRVTAALPDLSPAEQRVARLFVERREAVVLESAAELGAMIDTSDATVVRAAQSLGFESLSALREAVLSDLTGKPTPSSRLKRTLDETGNDSVAVLQHVIGVHEHALETLRAPGFQAQFRDAVAILAAAKQRRIFGIGPSGVLAEYAALQLTRIGLPSSALSVSGIALADRLLGLSARDAVLMIAYAPIYREVETTLDHARQVGAPVLLISDSLGPHVRGRVAMVLPVPRGKAGHLSLHAGTMVLVESLIIALAARNRSGALASLERLGKLRGTIDKSWLQRSGRKKGKRPNKKLQ
jgi:DNA-binding MurR/RpiR family transcriptional regulator